MQVRAIDLIIMAAQEAGVFQLCQEKFRLKSN